MALIDRSEIDPKGIYHLNLSGQVAAGEINIETGETTEIDNPSEHTHRTEMTGAQLIDWLERRESDPMAPFTYAVRDEELLAGDDGELVEADSAVPAEHDEA